MGAPETKKSESPLKGKPRPQWVKDKIAASMLESKAYREGLKKRRSFKNEFNPKFRGKVYQYTGDKKAFIAEWDFLQQAAEALGLKEENLCMCIYGKLPHAYGFFWTRERIEVSVEFVRNLF